MKSPRVWDLFIRFFHWSLVISVICQLVTAEDFKSAHVKVGYFIIALLILRILWGFVGSRHARFKNFIYPPADIFAYLKGLIQGRPRHYTGHNPAGGAMVCALLLFLGLTTLTGLLTIKAHGNGRMALLPGQGINSVWAHDTDHGDSDERPQSDKLNRERNNRHDHGGANDRVHFWKEIRESLVSITLFLIILHICGVIASSYVHRENLILAMITGNKKIS